MEDIEGIAMTGLNCSDEYDQMIKILIEMRKPSVLPSLIQPNAGLPVYIMKKKSIGKHTYQYYQK